MIRTIGRLFFLAVTLMLSVHAQTKPLRLVKDIAPGIEEYGSSDPAMFTRFGNHVYFLADDGEHDRAVWRTDGSTAGTKLLRDSNGVPVRNTRGLVAGSKLLFVVATGGLMRSDGTPIGTMVIAQFTKGPDYLFAHGDRLFFGASARGGTGLWVSDGTSAGTQFLQSCVLDPLYPMAFIALDDGTVLLAARTTNSYSDLWRTDGTRSGTKLLKASCVSNTFPFRPSFGRLGKGAVFVGYEANTGREPWWTDGTSAGTHIITDLSAGPASSMSPWTIHSDGRYAYFSANGGTRNGIWRTDGTSFGTSLIYASTSLLQVGSSSFVFQNRIYFDAGSRVLESDGTPNGTTVLLDEPTRSHGVFAGKLLADVNRSGSQTHLFDLTSRTWSRLTNPVDGTWQGVTSLGSRVVFSGLAARGDRELWSSDLTSAGTTLLADINQDFTPFDSDIDSLFVHDGKLFFAADDLVHGKKLWTSDGTSHGTKLVQDISTGPAGSDPRSFASFRGKLVFFATTYSAGLAYVDLWTSDGTTAGTRRWITLPLRANPDHLTVYRDRLYFAATTSNEGREIWISDGTQLGTKLFADFGPTWKSSDPMDFTVHGDELYFTAISPTTGRELFATDGTVAGTRLLLDVLPGSRSSEPGNLFSYGNNLFFAATTDTFGRELWATDGTQAGTRLVKDLAPGSSDSLPRAFVRTDEGLRFVAQDVTYGAELWQTDGTAAGTRILTDSLPGIASSFAPAIRPIALGRNIFFRGVDSKVGVEPFLYESATGATHVIAETEPGYQIRKVMTPGVLSGGTVYFAAHDPKAGYELFAWDSDVASVREVGLGCPNHIVKLEATAPVLGSTMRITGSGTGNKLGFVFLSLTRASSTNAFGCPDHVGVASATLLASVPTPNFELRLVVPSNPVFAGLVANLQSWFVNLNAARVESSNGLEVELGR